MNTKKAAEVMTLIAKEYESKRKMPNWKELGGIVMKRLAKEPLASTGDIADQVLRAYRDNASTNVE